MAGGLKGRERERGRKSWCSFLVVGKRGKVLLSISLSLFPFPFLCKMHTQRERTFQIERESGREGESRTSDTVRKWERGKGEKIANGKRESCWEGE